MLLSLRKQDLRTRLGIGFLFGLCAYGLMVQGLWPISKGGFLLLALGFSVQTLIFSALCFSTGKIWIDLFYYPFIWVLSEILRNGILGGFSFYISYSHAFFPPMLKLYGLLGVPMMSYLIFLGNTCLYMSLIYKDRRVRWLFGGISLILIIWVLGFFLVKHDEGRIVRVGIIQPNISPMEKKDPDHFDANAQLQLDLSRQLYLLSKPDIMVWPETAFPDDLEDNPQWKLSIQTLSQMIQTDILLGVAPIIQQKEYNTALLIREDGARGEMYHKQILLPFAEYAPLGLSWGSGYHFSSGSESTIFRSTENSFSFGVMICSESAYPRIARRLKQLGADFIIEMSNDGWLSEPSAYQMHAQAAVMRAVENQLWVIRATNSGYSFAVSPEGIIYEDMNLKLGRRGVGFFDIMIQNP